MKPLVRISAKPWRAWVSMACVASLAGCALVPGTYLGVKAKVDETDDAYVYDADDTKSIEERADIFAITPAAIIKQDEALAISKRGPQLATTAASEAYQYLVGPQDVLHVTV